MATNGSVTTRTIPYFAYPTTPTPATVALTIPASTATGATTLTVTATDRAGRTATSAPLAFTIIANAPPAITELVAAPPSVYPGKSIVATVSATDDLQVTKLTFTSTVNNGTPATQTKTPNSAAVTDTFTVAVPITTPGGAPFTLDVAVEDAFPGRTATTQSLNVTILTDTVAPSLNVTSPASGTIYQEGTGALIQVRATAVDAEVGVKQVYAQFDGGTQYPLTAGANGSFSADIPVPNVDGIDVVTKQLVVTAKDYENNAAVATAIPIQIRPLNDPNAPVVQWTCASNGALLPAGVAARLRVYAIGNDVGNAANGVQKVELFVGDATTPIAATAVSGLANHYEATYTIPAGTADGTELAIRALVTNTAGLQSDMTTRATVVTGTTFTTNTNISAGDTTYDGQTVIVQSGTLTIAGQHAFARLVVLGGAKVTHLATDATTIQRLTFNAGAVYVACDGALDASGRGFAGAAGGSGRTWPNTTTGGSYNGAGGSHGGRGGAHDQNGDSAPAYGSLLDPNEPGGAGGLWFQGTCAACGAGGGVIRVAATTFVVDGNVLANGVNDTGSGPGAGGSIRIDAGTLSGSGEIRADAGPAGHTGGGGGRIAVYAQSLTLDRTKITAAGSLYTNNSTRTGSAGTVYIESAGTKELIADNLDRPSQKTTLLATPDTGAADQGLWRFDQVTARRQATIETAGLETPLIITDSTGLVRADVLREDDIILRGRVEAGSVTASTLALQNGATLGHAPTTGTKINKLTVDVETLTVDATSSIDVTGRGLTGVVNGFARTGSNVTTGGSVNGAGGSHGGRGGAHDAAGESAATYGSLFDPDTPGGAGANANAANCDPCGSGGGVARIKANTFVLDGKLLANGINTGSGGGAGGSIRIDAGSLSGAGEIRAEGGPTTHTAGGGGRIAVYYRNLTFDRAKITAAGGLHTGNATRTGGAGTVYFRRVDASGTKLDDELVLDNRDRVGTHLTPVESATFDLVTIRGAAIASSDTISAPVLTSTSNAYIELNTLSRDAFTLRGWVRVNGNVDVPTLALEAGAKLEVDGLVKSTTLTLTNGAVLSQAPTTSTKIARLTVEAATINVDAASAIDVSGKGFIGTVSGNGRTWPNTATGGSVNGSGGSHGGRGGAHDQHGDSAQAYGSVFDPDTPGGAGGQWFQDTCATCNAGGGIARIQAATFVLDGKVLANGTNSGQSGAGAGGSIRIDAQSLTGTGEIHADSGPTFHTGGGGGRIAIYVPALGLDKAKITAAGGLYTNNTTRTGAAGTVYIQTTGANELLVDNVDRPSAKETTLPSLGTGTVVSAGGGTIGLSNPAPEWIEGSFIELLGVTYPIVARNAANVITVQGTPPVGIGTPYRGLWRFDGVTVKRQSVLSTDVLNASLVETTASSLVRPNELRGDDLVLRGRVETNTVTARNLALQNNAFLTHPVTTTSQVYRLTLNVQQALTVDATSTIDVSSRGYTGSTNGYGTTWSITAGPNTTTNGSYNGAGGSHGGRGGQHDTYGDSAPTYGSLFDPTLPGAAGGQYSVATCNPCNPGGGVVRITAGSVAVDGKILANGAGAGSGGGAGGSIRIDTGTLSGAGDIRAEGGATGHVAGGGGRIAVYYENLTFNAAKILAPGGLYTNNPTRTGAAGTVYLKQTAQQYGDLIVDNAGRNSAKNTVLPSIGFRTVTHVGPAFVRDSSASFPAPDFLARMRLVVNHNKSVTWPIVTNDATTVNVDTTSAPLAAQVGNSFRGLYRFDNTKLRSSRLEVHDLFESGTAIDKDTPSALLGSNLAPVLTPSLITLQSTPTNSSIVGAAGAALDPDAPLVLTATNLGTGNTFVVNANVDGSFVIPLQGNQGDRITLKGKDSNFFPLETALLDLGTMQFGTPPPGFLDKTEWTSDTNFRARIVAADDRNLIVAGGGSDKVAIFGLSDPARPALVRTVTLSDGAVSDLAIVNGWAVVVANDIVLLDLSSPTSSPVYIPDYGNIETSIAVADGFAYVATPHFTDGRIRIYDVSTVSNTRYVREQAMVPSVNFTSVLAYGDRYLIAITPTRPGGTGHDVVVIDRSNMYGLVKVADFDVPSFDAYYGAVNGTRLHLTSPGSAEVVVVELANPAAPAVVGRTTMSANGGRPAMIDDSVFVAASTAGLVEVDASNPAAPAVIAVSPTTGTAYDVELRTPWAYVASDLGLSVIAIATPPQIDASRITMGVASQIVTVSGTAGSIRGSAPIGVVIENVSSGATGTGSVAANGTFTASVGGLPGDVITLTATDSAARTAGPVLLGRVPLGSGVINTIFPPSLTGETQYRARTVASAGNHLIVGGAFDGNSTRLLVFDVTNPAVPVYKRTVALSDGAINQVAIQDHWAIIVANDVVLLDLDNPTSAPIYVPDYGNVEYDITFSDGYAFTATPHFTDGRIRVYDISSLPTVRYVREQPTVPSVNFTGIAALGSRYLVAMTEMRPGGVGHDVVVIDRGNLHNMVKVADLDIPNFNAFRGELVGNTLYLAGTTGGMAVVDLTNPLAPVVKSIVPLAAARGVEAIGNTVFVGNGSAGVTLVDTADPAAPSVFGTLKLPGTAWSAAFNRGNLYVATEQGLSVIQNIATAPMVEPSRLSVTPSSATLATVSGTANSVYGLGPLTVAVKNTVTGSTISGRAVASNGSFSVLMPAALSESLAVEATDAIGRKSGWVPAGSVPFGTAVDTYLIDGTVTGQPYTARTLATDGRWLLVGGYADGNSTKLLVYDVADPAVPQLQRVVALSDGAINNVAIHDGWAVVAANDIVLLDLSNPSSSPLYIPDYGNIESDLAISGGYAFTATPHFTDSRIRIYDVSRPSSTRYVREQVMGIPSLNFNGLIPVGTNYLVATSDYRPGGTGHDVVVIDRTNVYNLVKVFDLDIPNFDAFRGKVVGNTLYVAGRGGGLAILDVTDPRTPVLLKVMATAGSTNGVDGYGSLLAVADGGSGVSFLDITTPATAQLFGTQRIGGNAYNVAFNRGHLYAVNEQALIVIRDFGAAPNVAPSLVTVTFDGIDTATVTGAAHAISGAGTLTFEARNARTGASAQGTAALNGSFSASVAVQPGDLLTVEATDEAGRKSGRVHVGMVPFGTITAIPITPAMSETNFRPRMLVTDGKYLVVGSYGDGSSRIVIFDVSNPAVPQFLRNVNLSDGVVNAVAIHNGWAIVAANDIVTLDLSNPTAAPVYVPDFGNTETTLAVSGGYAFTTTPHFSDGRFRVYDVSNPAAPRYVREQILGVNAVNLTAVGSDYLVATSSGHDVVVIDRRNVYALAKVADIDIPAFDGFRGRASGTTLYLGGSTGGLAIVDLSNPKVPVVKQVYQTPGDPLASDVNGSMFAVADAAAGVTFLDVSSPFAPQHIGTQATGGTVWATAFNRGALYAANEQGLIVLTNVVPMFDRSLITIAPDTITGAARSVAGIAPLTVNLRNARTNASTGTVSVAANGSFTATLISAPTDPLEITVTDAVGRTNTLSLGNAAFGTVTTQLAGPPQAANDTNYRARRIASDGASTIVTSGSTYGLSVPTSGRAIVFRSGSVQNYQVSNAINDVAISGGYAYIAANDFAALNLSNPSATAFVAADAGNTELSVAILNGYAYTATPAGNDARIRIYNLANPAQPVFYREQSMALGALTFTKVLAFAPNYLVGIADGHDAVLIDASNPAVLVKLADLDIPNFTAIDGAVEGTTLYLAGGDAGIAVVDFTGTPAAPAFTTAIIDTPGIARGVTVSGTREIAVADGSSGVTFIDATTRTAPVLLGTHVLSASNVVGVTAVGRTVYAAADNQFHTITRFNP